MASERMWSERELVKMRRGGGGPRKDVLSATTERGPKDLILREELLRLLLGGERSAREIALMTGYSQRSVVRRRKWLREGHEYGRHRDGCRCPQVSRHS